MPLLPHQLDAAAYATSHILPALAGPSPWLAGVLIALDPRTGKTPTAIEIVNRLESLPLVGEGNFSDLYLVVAPSDVVAKQWVESWQTWGDGMKGIYIPNHAHLFPTRLKLLTAQPAVGGALRSAPGVRVLCVSYDTLRTRIDDLAPIQWRGIVLDEIHRLGNWYTWVTAAAMRLNSLYRIGLSGTPFANQSLQLHPVLTWLQGQTVITNGQANKYAPSWGSFSQWQEWAAMPSFAPWVNDRLDREVMFRRTFKQCSTAPIPPIEYVAIPMSAYEKGLYNQLKAGALKNEKVNSVSHLAAMGYAMQLLFYPPQLTRKEEPLANCSKLAWIASKLRTISGQVLLLTEYCEGMDQLAGEIATLTGKQVAVINGSNKADRDGLIDGFRKGEYDCLLMNKVATEGIDLSCADTVIVIGKLDWNATAVRQAINRIVSMFKTREGKVYILYAPGTVEQWLYQQIIADKLAVFESIVDGAVDRTNLLYFNTPAKVAAAWGGGLKQAA